MSRHGYYNYSVQSAAARAAAEALRQAERERQRQERKRRHEEWLRRTAETTRAHLDRYQGILDDIQRQSLEEFVASEFAEISRLIRQSRAVIDSDPAAARDLCKEIGPKVGPLPRAARNLRGQQRARELSVTSDSDSPPRLSAPRRASESLPQAVESPVEIAWREGMAAWADLLARDLAFEDLTTLRREIELPGGITEPSIVTSRLTDLSRQWGAAADAARQQESELVDVTATFPDEPAEVESSEPTTEIVGNSGEQDPEADRREAVRAVIGALEDAGFLVAPPRLVDGDVVVVGTRASGASASFNLTLDGGLNYDFSGYRGSNCESDIDAVVPALQEVYGIQLTDEVVAWRNPDDEDATARPQPGRTRNA